MRRNVDVIHLRGANSSDDKIAADTIERHEKFRRVIKHMSKLGQYILISYYRDLDWANNIAIPHLRAADVIHYYRQHCYLFSFCCTIATGYLEKKRFSYSLRKMTRFHVTANVNGDEIHARAPSMD